MKRFILISTIASLVFFAGGVLVRDAVRQLTFAPSAWAQHARPARSQKPALDVPFVPSKAGVVAEMLRLADVRDGDVVYDLGCGDGRIVISAAKRGAKCVGIDKDPERIKECNVNAEREGVADKVRFVEQDIFETDFSEATVLALYLMPEINMKLRPRILNELKPGTRIVSHDFDMGEWQPEHVSRGERASTVFLWVVPANIGGVWQWDMPAALAGAAAGQYTLTLAQEFQKATGVLAREASAWRVEEVKLYGDRIEFVVEQQGVLLAFEGRVKAHSIEGSMQWQDSGRAKRATWRAHRDPSTVTRLGQGRAVSGEAR